MLRRLGRALRILTVVAAMAPALMAAAPAHGALAAPDTVARPPAGAHPAATPTAAYTISSFDAVYDLGRDAERQSTLTTTETIVADFAPSAFRHGIIRALPRFEGGVDLRLKVVSVTGPNGRAVPYTVSTDEDDSDFVLVRIGDADRYVSGSQTYVIRYTSRYVVAHFADTHSAEFYWDVNGSGWDAPFASVTATVRLHNGTASGLTGELSCYQGYSGSTQRCAIDRSGDSVTARATGLADHQTMTVAIGFAPDTFAVRPLASHNWAYALVPWLLLALALAGAARILALRLGPWRDARGRGIIVPEYTPGAGMYPALAAALLRRKKKWFPAQLVSFAVNGVLSLREDSPKGWKSYTAVLGDGGAAELQPDETALLKALFPRMEPGEEARLTSTNQALRERVPRHARDAAWTATERGLRESPAKRGSGWVALGLLLVGAAAIVHLSFAANAHGATAWTWVIDLVVPAIAITFTVLSFPRDRLTDSGAQARDRLRGLREFIRVAEADRIRVLQSPAGAERVDTADRGQVVKLYEKLLPYAIVWGLEKKWAATLAEVSGPDEAPSWHPGNNVASFAALSAISSAASSVAAPWSAPDSSASSSSGGSSGGGYAGGGGGGGGGSSW